MKNRSLFLIVAAMLMLLIACDTGQAGRESVEQGEYKVPENDAGSEVRVAEAPADEKDATPAGRAYEKETVNYREPEGEGGLSFRKDMEKTQTDYAAYYFEVSISEQEREECIAVTDSMLSGIDGAVPELEIVVLEPRPTYGVCVSDGRLYLSLQPWSSADYLAKVLLAGYGGWGNYGLAYGYADYLCRKVELDSGEISEGRGGEECFLSMSVPEAYDLNLLCFEEEFVSSGDVEAAKNNACLFVREYLSSHSEEEFLELLSQSGTPEGVAQANKVLEAFYAENGVECNLTGIRYRYGGLSLDYASACKYASFRVQEDWQDVYWEQNPIVSENFLHEKYGEVRKFFECSERRMEQYQELFGFDSYDNSLLVLMQDLSYVRAKESFYRPHEHIIYLNAVHSLMHEYIHSVTCRNVEDTTCLWKIEGFATYFSYKYDEYAYDFINYYIDNNSEKWVQEYADTLGRPIDARTDFYNGYVDAMMYVYGITDPNSEYLSGASFISYLVKQYGERAVIDYVCSDHEYNEEWDKSYDELVQEWNRYIEENYSEYSKIEF